MFIHFDSSEAENCDDCGNPTSLAHVCAKQSPRGLNLCAACFRRFTLAIVQACKKLGAASRFPVGRAWSQHEWANELRRERSIIHSPEVPAGRLDTAHAVAHHAGRGLGLLRNHNRIRSAVYMSESAEMAFHVTSRKVFVVRYLWSG